MIYIKVYIFQMLKVINTCLAKFQPNSYIMLIKSCHSRSITFLHIVFFLFFSYINNFEVKFPNFILL